jgi:NAD(P)-dependent dehydrogenase (short-subunit alcohol dehydrogenase family)
VKIEAGQVAVVTGGTSGIGFGLADALVRRGVNVMLADIREDAIPVAVDALAGRPGHAAGVRADVSVDADLDALADETVERFGRVDLVCNNAGVVCEGAPTWEQRPATWRWLIDVKLMGVVGGRTDGASDDGAVRRHHARGCRADRDSQRRTSLGVKPFGGDGAVPRIGGYAAGSQLGSARSAWRSGDARGGWYARRRDQSHCRG